MKDEVCTLGVLLDLSLLVTSQIASVVQSGYFHLMQIAQLHPYLDTGSLTMLVHVLVVLRLDYCNDLYLGLPLGLLQRLQQVQNVVARLSSWFRKYQHISTTLAALHWLPFTSVPFSR